MPYLKNFQHRQFFTDLPLEEEKFPHLKHGLTVILRPPTSIYCSLALNTPSVHANTLP